MYKTDSFISADEIKEIIGVSKSKAYNLVQELNAELKEKGYLTVPGRVSRKYFEERFYGLVEDR
jgi:predicted transcriptional regulator of viral defense system